MATRRRRSVPLLLSAGCACVVMVLLSHVAERLGVLPAMGWGLPDSPGHYLDLASAVSGISFLLAAVIVRLLERRSSHP